jgi:thiol-disulfide isomerase/thioredoxin
MRSKVQLMMIIAVPRRMVGIALIAAIVMAASVGARPANAKGLYDYGAAPEFAGIERWLNTEPLTLTSLRGKVVLVDFWTYSCSNCIRTLPYVRRWYDTYKHKGFMVVGVHTPEFPHEHKTKNVQAAIERHGIAYPVAQDNKYATWKAYDNKFWPAAYLIDRNGRIMLKHYGEGRYDEMENAIRTLLAAN